MDKHVHNDAAQPNGLDASALTLTMMGTKADQLATVKGLNADVATSGSTKACLPHLQICDGEQSNTHGSATNPAGIPLEGGSAATSPSKPDDRGSASNLKPVPNDILGDAYYQSQVTRYSASDNQLKMKP